MLSILYLKCSVKYITKNKDDLAEYAKLLYDQALLIEGLPIEDPVAFSMLYAG